MKWAVFSCCVIVSGQTTAFHLDSVAGLQPSNVKAEPATYRNRRAVHLIDQPAGSRPGEAMAALSTSDFGDGTIEVDLAGAPRQGSSDTARGFLGIAFHVQADLTHFECFYLRPTNG